EYAIDGDSALRSLEAGLAAAEAEDRGALMGELHAALADAGLYTARSRAERLLAGLGFAAGELDLPVSSFSGGWRMRLKRAQALVLAASQQEQQARERAHLQSFIDRFKAKATKARQAQSRMKMLAKMEQLAPLHVAAPFSFEFREPLRAPNPLLVLDDVDAGYPEKRVLKNIKLSLQAEQRIGLLGVNGAGKSTL